MKKILLLLILLTGALGGAFGQPNHLFKNSYRIGLYASGDGFICMTRPNTYDLNISFGDGVTGNIKSFVSSSSANTNGSGPQADYFGEDIREFTSNVQLTNFSFSDNFTSDTSVPLNLGINNGSKTVNLCGLVTGTFWTIGITKLSFNIDYSGEYIICGNKTIAFSIPTSPEPSYILQASNDPLNSSSWETISILTTDKITFNQTLLPSSIERGVPTFFRIIGTYDGFAIQSDYIGITFYPSIPIPQTKTPIAPSCFGGKGSINLSNFKYDDGTAYNGGESLTLSITNQASGIPETPITFTTSTLSVANLAPGNYTAQLGNAAATCTSSFSFTIPPAPAPITASASVQNPDCSSGLGTITATANGGTPPYRYSIDGGANYQTSNTFNNLTAGSYIVTVTDANNCIPATSAAISVSIPTAVVVSLSNKTNPNVFGLSNGQISIAASGGTGTGYTYAINDGTYTSADTFSSLAAGTYNFTAKDSKGCLSAPLSITLTEPQPLTLNIVNKTDNSCFGASSGEIEVLASGGTAPYSYALNGGSLQTSASFSGLAVGFYTVTVTDANNNTASINTAISQPNKITATVTKADATCFGANGTVTISSPSGGLSNTYFYSTDGGASYQNNNIISLAPGTYNIKIKDSNGCLSDDYSMTISQPAASLNATATSEDAQCYGAANGSITVVATGGSGSYSYSIDNWVSSNADGTFNGLLAGQYTVRVKDQTGCTFSLPILVKQPQELQIFIDSKTDASCFGGTGTISVSATGGQGNMSYSSSPSLAFNNGLFSGATAGTYTIQVTDDNGCTKTTSVIINQPSQISISASTTPVSCNGGIDGQIVLNASGGTGTYTYSFKNLNNFSSSNTFSGLTAGNYSFTVKDQNGCLAEVTVELNQPDALSIVVANKQNVSCNGSANGSISVTAAGGSGSYAYQINGASAVSNGIFTGLAPGNYTIRVTDANGCYKELIETITEPSSLSLSLTNQVNVKCFGNNSGQITVSATGGSGSYQYSLDGFTYQASPTFNGLSASNYTVQVKDGNQCTTSINVLITEPTQLTASVSKQDVNCFGEASGAVIISASGGEQPYSYAINGGSFQLSNTFSALPAGSYTISIRDKNNCEFTTQANIINVAPKLNLSLSANSPATCNALGSITVNSTTGGVAPYAYSIDGTNFSASNTFSSLAAGTYTIFVRDSNGCTTSATASIIVPSGISATATAINVGCYAGNDGSIQVTQASGGNGNYLYSINGGAFQSSATFNGLSAGTYSITVKDNPYSCQYQLNVAVTAPQQLTIELKSKSDIACYGQNSGRITIAATGGTSPYLYSIDGLTYQSGTNFTGLAAGTYNLLVKDANQCTTQMSVTIVQPVALSLSVANTTDVDCNGAKNGSITLTALGGTTPYSYAINGSAPQSSNKFGNLNGGNYTITVTDANGCSKSISTVINESSQLTIAISSFKNLSCNGNASGEITLMAQGGSGGYQYSLNNGAFQTSAVFGQLQAGTYQIMVKDAKGCTASVSKTITQPMPLVLSKQVIQQKCFDACSGEIKLNVSGGTAPYTYQWLGGVYGNVSTISNLCGGLYSVTITDANGCTIADATTIITPPEIKITGVADTILCVDQVVTYDAGNPGFSYLWTADNGFLKNTQKVQISQAGKYQLKVTNLDGCSVTKTFNVQTSTTLLKANFLMSTYANVGDTVIVVEVSKPTPAKITWLFDNGVVNAGGNASGSVKQITFTSPGVYNLMLMVNLGQCADAVQKSITVLPKEQKAEVNKVLGYKEELIKEFKVYPNPNDGQFKALVKLSDKNDIKLSLYDFNGAVVLPSQAYVGKDVYEVDFSQKNIRPGVYILALEAGTQVKTLKIIKI